MGDGDHASILLDQPHLHVPEVLSEKGELGVAVCDRLVQVLVVQLVCLCFLREVTIRPRFKAVQELVDGDLTSGLEGGEGDLSHPEVFVQVEFLPVVSGHQVTCPGRGIFAPLLSVTGEVSVVARVGRVELQSFPTVVDGFGNQGQSDVVKIPKVGV